MEKKLLHERLREQSEGSLLDLGEVTGSGRCDTIWSVNARFLADEIERYYIPRPRFEDGEPVQFGDSAKRDFGTDDAINIDKFVFYRGGTVDVSGANGHFATSRNGAGLKRLPPKVYDADGVEIKVGDTVYELENGKELRIKEADAHHILCAHVDGWGSYEGFVADQLTHERPVFDANGERIKVGDTVYEVKTGLESVVQRTDSCNSDRKPIICKDGCPGELWYKPEELTHREPDSQEAIDADVGLSGKAYCQKHNLTPHEASCGKSTKYKHLFKRQRALIERGVQ